MDSNSSNSSKFYRLLLEVLTIFFPLLIVVVFRSQQLISCLKFGFLPTLISSCYIYIRRSQKFTGFIKGDTYHSNKSNLTRFTGFVYCFLNHPECEELYYKTYSGHSLRSINKIEHHIEKNGANATVRELTLIDIGGFLSIEQEKNNENTKPDSSQEVPSSNEKNIENSKRIRLGSPMLFGMLFIPLFMISINYSESNLNNHYPEIWLIYPNLMATTYCFSFLIRFSPIHIIDLLTGALVHYLFSLAVNHEIFKEIYGIYFIGSSLIVFTVLVLEIFMHKTKRALNFNEAIVLSQLVVSFIFFTIWGYFKSNLENPSSYRYQLGNYLSFFSITQISFLCVGSHIVWHYVTSTSQITNTLVITAAIISIAAAGSFEFENYNLFLWLIHLLIEDYENSCIIFTWAIISILWLFYSTRIIKSESNSDFISLRKGFHFLIVFILLIAIYFGKMNLLFSILHLVIWFFVFIEFFRIINDKTIASGIIFQFYSKFLAKNSRDTRLFIFSHVYLILGISIPIFISEYQGRSSSSIVPFLGIIVTGIGDSLGAIVGRKYGKTPLLKNEEKTVEGSASFLISCIISTIIIKALIGGLDFNWYKIILTYIMATLFESYTQDIDNLNLPLFTFIVYESLNLIK